MICYIFVFAVFLRRLAAERESEKAFFFIEGLPFRTDKTLARKLLSTGISVRREAVDKVNDLDSGDAS